MMSCRHMVSLMNDCPSWFADSVTWHGEACHPRECNHHSVRQRENNRCSRCIIAERAASISNSNNLTWTLESKNLKQHCALIG